MPRPTTLSKNVTHASDDMIGDSLDRLSALWALRLVLKARDGNRFLRSKAHADDLLAIIGPWVDWPRNMKAMFAQELALPSAMDDFLFGPDEVDLSRTKTGLEDGASAAEIAAIDWRRVDWRQLNGPFCSIYACDADKVIKLLTTTVRKLEKQAPDTEHPLIANVARLSEVLKLKAEEQLVLLFYALGGEHTEMRSLLRTLSFRGMHKVSNFLADVLDLPKSIVNASLRESGTLVRSGLITYPRHANDLEDVFRLDEDLQRIITQPHDSIESLMGQFLELSRPGQLAASDFAHQGTSRRDLTELLQAALYQGQTGVNVLLYGPPGTGKTEFARMLAAEMSVNLFTVKAGEQNGDMSNKHGRLTHYHLAQNFLRDNDQSVLLFDEVEDVLGGDAGLSALSMLFGGARSGNNSRKAWINQALETNPVPTIWISNSIDAFDPAFLRRFLYSVEFSNPPRGVRRQIVERHLGQYSLSESCRERLSHEALTPAQLDTLSRVIGLINPGSVEDTEALLNRTLRASMAVLKQEPAPAKDSVTHYRLDFLNIDSRIPLERLVGVAERGQPLSLCLAGPPGTGKTQLAHYLAQQVDRPLLTKRASDILNKYVGGTEQNLARIFNEARHENAVLLLDEADSLLQNRGIAERSWEVTQVNELLQQMESFDGLFVCTTNRFEQLDPASLRRFTAKLSFGYLTPRQRWHLFLQESGLSAELTHEDLQPLRRRLDRLDTLTPGDYATVKRQFIALGEAPDAETFVSHLEEEIRTKDIHCQRRCIGFVQ